MRLHIGGKHINLKGYMEADWTDDVENRRATSRYIFMLEKGPCCEIAKTTNSGTIYNEGGIHDNEPMHEGGHLA